LPASGNMFGNNSLETKEYAEEYKINSNGKLFGAYIVTPSITESLKNLDVEIVVYGGADKPETLLYSQKFYPTYTDMSIIDSTFLEVEKRLNRAQESFVRFDSLVDVNGSFFVGYRINYPDNSTFAVYNLPKGKTSKNTAWINNKGTWIKASGHSLLPFNTSLFIDPVIQYTTPTSIDKIDNENPVFVLFSNDKKNLYIQLSDNINTADFLLYSITGQLILNAKNIKTDKSIAIPHLAPGIYVACLKGNNLFYTQKLNF